MPSSTKLVAIAAAVGAIIGGTAAAGAAPMPGSSSSPAACAGVTLSTFSSSRTPVVEWAENVVYAADGTLWVSRVQRNVVEHLDRNGAVLDSVRVHAPGAVRFAPDGSLLVLSGNTVVNQLPWAPRTGRIMRVDLHDRVAEPQVVVGYLGMPNGMAVAADGSMYVADSVLGVLRFAPDGSRDHEWSNRVPTGPELSGLVNGVGANGATISGDSLYVTYTASLSGRVFRIPLDAPDQASIAADLTAPLPGFLDDLATTTDGRLLIASLDGTVRVVDPTTRAQCSIPVGQPATAVAADPLDPATFAVTTLSGDIVRVQVP